MSKLNLKETQFAIDKLKTLFSSKLAKTLNLVRVSAPLFLLSSSHLNDPLNGEEPVKFKAKNIDGDLEIIHSLAKWKRYALSKYNFNINEGIYTDMNAIRREEEQDDLHSIYVDQWDWELIIKKEDRNLNFLQYIVKKIYQALYEVENEINLEYPQLSKKLTKDIYFISSQELLDKYPNLDVNQREYEISKKYGAVFIYKIGYNLTNNKPHSSRAKDYDDWNLNGDIIIYDKLHDRAIELSSMGIRVNKDSLIKQMNMSESKIKSLSDYHKQIINETLPFTIGGGLGQSRIALFLLEKEHIGEVQVSVWDQKNINKNKLKKLEIL